MSSQTLCTESAQTRNLKKSLNTSKAQRKLDVLNWSLHFQMCIFVVQGSDVVVFLYSFICRDLLKQFTTMELMRWTSLVDDYKKELRDGSPDSPATDVFSYSEEGEKRWKDLKNRVVEHVSWRTYSLFPTSGPVWFGPEKFGTWSQLREMLFHHWANQPYEGMS